MKVYVIQDCFECVDIVAICATQEIAEAKLKELNAKYEAYYIEEMEVLT